MANKDDGFRPTVYNDDATRLRETMEIYSFLEAGNKNDIQSYKDYMAYYTGSGQWTDAERALLESEGRPPLTFNFIFSKVNTVAGLEQQIRSGYKVYPVASEDENLARIAGLVLRHEDRNKRLQKVFSRAFKTAAVCGRGWIDCSVEQLPGELTVSNVIRNESVYNVYKDPDGKELDMSDWTYMSRQKWLTIGQLKLLYPDIFMGKSNAEIAMMVNFTPDERYPHPAVEYVNDYPTNPNINDWSSFVDNEKRRAKIIELWTKKTEHGWFIATPDGDMYEAGKSKEEAETVAANLTEQSALAGMQQQFTVVKVPRTVIYQDVFSGNLMIRKQMVSPYRHGKFPIVPVFAYVEDTGSKMESFGIVKNLVDLQDEKNKRHSQFTDILNRAPKGGGFYQMSAVDAEQIKALSTPGAWVGVRGNIKDKIQSSSANYIGILGHYQWLEAQAEEDAKAISGINDSLVGMPTNSRESGIAAQTRIQQGLTTMQELFDNLNTAKIAVAEQLLSNIQQFYAPNKITKIVGIQNKKEPNWTVEATQELIEKFYSMKYDVQIDEGETSPTARIASVQSAKELLQYATAMPPAAVMTIVQAIVDMSDFPGKQEILDKLGQAEQMAQAAEMMEAQQGQGE